VALQRKGVKPDGFGEAIESIPNCPQIAKELPQEGARGVQTLYMTDRMHMNINTRERESVRRFAPGS
jgi:hypothetical protein